MSKRNIRKLVCAFLLALSLSVTSIYTYTGENVLVVRAAEIRLNKKSVELCKDKSVTLKLKNCDSNVRWSSSDKSVAVVSQNGVVTGVKRGKAIIRARVGKETYKCTVTVIRHSYVDNFCEYCDEPDSEGIKESLMMHLEEYPEGLSWDNSDFYAWNGGIYYGGYGCAAFAFTLSDEAFYGRPAKIHKKVSNIRLGDILRINDDSHSVIVIDIEDGVYTVAEGNYNSTVHWGRCFTEEQLEDIVTYVMTRY